MARADGDGKKLLQRKGASYFKYYISSMTSECTLQAGRKPVKVPRKGGMTPDSVGTSRLGLPEKEHGF